MPILSQISSVHGSPYYFLIHFNIILWPMLRSYKWSLSLRFPHLNHVCIYPLLHMFHMPHISHSSWFDHPNNSIWWGVQIRKLLFTKSPPVSWYLFSLRPNYLLQHPILQHSAYVSISMWEIKFHTRIKQLKKGTVLCILIFILSDKLDDKRCRTEW